MIAFLPAPHARPPSLHPGPTLQPGRRSPVAVASMGENHSSSQDLELQLPPALQLHVLSFLPPHDRALSGRLVSPDAAAALSTDPTCTASLSQPVPPHAVPWAAAAADPQRAQQLRQLPFWHKLQLLCTAAATGCEANLEVALALLQPSIFLELLQSPDGDPSPGPGVWNFMCRGLDRYGALIDPFAFRGAGMAAVLAGHPQLLGWLLRHCPRVVDCRQVLEAAAQHCSLEGLQVACAALQSHLDSSGSGGNRQSLGQATLDAAASSPTPDALEKVEWLLSVGGSDCSLGISTAAAAAPLGGPGPAAVAAGAGLPCGEHQGAARSPGARRPDRGAVAGARGQVQAASTVRAAGAVGDAPGRSSKEPRWRAKAGVAVGAGRAAAGRQQRQR